MICLVYVCSLIFPFSLPSKISIYNFIDVSNIKYEIFDDKMLSTWNENNLEHIFKNVTNNIFTNNFKIYKNNIKFAISVFYLVTFVTILTKDLFLYLKMYFSVGNNNLEDERINLILEESKKKLKIKKNIKIIKQNLINVPSIIGIFNVKILVTDQFLELDDVSMQNIFMHELSHYKKKDNIVNFILIILKALYWINPIVYIMFKDIRNNMEYATDEMAIDKMNIDEKQNYCMLILTIATTFGKSNSQILGISNGAKNLKNRITWITRKDDFKKNSKKIFTLTSLIIIFMCLLFYPTSYGTANIPELCFELEDGKIIEFDNSNKINEITVKQNSNINLFLKNNKSNSHIVYMTEDLDEIIDRSKTVNITSKKIIFFDIGKYTYKFNLTYGNNKNIEYIVKINVE